MTAFEIKILKNITAATCRICSEIMYTHNKNHSRHNYYTDCAMRDGRKVQ